jgi:serine/threonine protein kinase
VPKDFIDNCVAYKDMMHGFSQKPIERKFDKYIKSLCPTIPEDAIDLLAGMLDLNPKTRLNCNQILKHPFFINYPLPCYKNEITKFDYDDHELLKNSSIKIERISHQ